MREKFSHSYNVLTTPANEKRTYKQLKQNHHEQNKKYKHC